MSGLSPTDEPSGRNKSSGGKEKAKSRKSSDFSRNSCVLGAVSSDLTAELSKFVETQILESFMCLINESS